MMTLPKRYKKLTRARFEQWLREHPKHRFTQDSLSCPIAKYLNDCYPHNIHLVGANLVGVRGVSGAVRLPKWAKEFIMRWDSTQDYQNLHADKALQISEGL